MSIEKKESRFSVITPKTGSSSLAISFQIYFFLLFSSRKLHKNYQMPDKINSHICLMLNVEKNVHKTIKYGCQKHHILQDLTGLEIQILMRRPKNRKPIWNRFSTTKTGCQKPVLTTLVIMFHSIWSTQPDGSSRYTTHQKAPSNIESHNQEIPLHNEGHYIETFQCFHCIIKSASGGSRERRNSAMAPQPVWLQTLSLLQWRNKR